MQTIECIDNKGVGPTCGMFRENRPFYVPEKDWQQKIADAAQDFAVFQDVADKDVWNNGFGGRHDDIMIYDNHQKLFARKSRFTEDENDIVNPSGWTSVRKLVIEASSQSIHRCDGLPLPEDNFRGGKDSAGMAMSTSSHSRPHARWQVNAPTLIVGLTGFAGLALAMRRKASPNTMLA